MPEIIPAAPPAACPSIHPADPMLPAPYRIGHVRSETHDTFTLFLEPANGRGPIQFAPGQFNMLYAFGHGEVPISVSSDPAKPEALQHTVRDVGGVTHSLRKLKRGDAIGVRGPFGTHWPIDLAEGRDVVIVAGGLGLAPLRPAIYRLLGERRRFGRIVLLYGARAPEEILFGSELRKWSERGDTDVCVTVDRAGPEWKGHVGVVTPFIGKSALDPANTVAFVCGPEVMMRFALMELHNKGLPADRTYLSMERNMKCAVGFCGHCQFGPAFVCRDGPIFRHDQIAHLLAIPEI